jgi:glycosyltransferase involved in cell wall biosynthesis
MAAKRVANTEQLPKRNESMISILMAVFNGEKYLAEQIESILCQTEQGFVLYICDDCSTDSTYSISLKYAERCPAKIVAERNNVNSGGAKYNFMRMMLRRKNDYVMLCDQDDVWLPDKIAITLEKMKESEAAYGAGTPILVHTDLCVTDAALNITAQSYRRLMNANFDRTKLKDLLIQNIVTGCTAMYNRALAELITAEPSYTVMHDWWLAILAAAFGRIAHSDAATMLYRQHEDNELGAWDARSIAYKLDRLRHIKEVRRAIYDTFSQAESFLALYGAGLSATQLQLIETYIGIPSMPKWRRWQTICRLGVLKHGIVRKIANFLYI